MPAARPAISEAGATLALRQVRKTFPGVQAVSEVDLEVRPGETVGIVGENGAGKSTLMKIISGVYPAGSYDGELALDGEPRRFRSVRDAEAAGVVLVPQELYVAPGLSVAENMFMNRLPGAVRLPGSPGPTRNDEGAAALLRDRNRAGRAGWAC